MMLLNLSALGLGLLGSTHCVSMCGPLAGLCGASTLDARPSIARTLAFNGGRIATYAVLGAAVGLLGQDVNGLHGVAPQVGAALRIVAALVALAAGIALVSGKSALASLERLLRPIGLLIRKRTAPWVGATGFKSFIALGLAWGLVPCGLVYGALALAATSGGALAGGAMMFYFGLGTLPALMLVGLASRAARTLSSPFFRRAAGTLLVIAGAVQLANVALPTTKETCCHHSASSGQ